MIMAIVRLSGCLARHRDVLKRGLVVWFLIASVAYLVAFQPMSSHLIATDTQSGLSLPLATEIFPGMERHEKKRRRERERGEYFATAKGYADILPVGPIHASPRVELLASACPNCLPRDETETIPGPIWEALIESFVLLL
jgi:hypothetical protein